MSKTIIGVAREYCRCYKYRPEIHAHTCRRFTFMNLCKHPCPFLLELKKAQKKARPAPAIDLVKKGITSKCEYSYSVGLGGLRCNRRQKANRLPDMHKACDFKGYKVSNCKRWSDK